MRDEYLKYVLFAAGFLALVRVMALLFRPKAYGTPIQNQVYTLPRNLWKSYDKRGLDEIDMAVIHHSATESGNPEVYAKYHVHQNGWPGIGYHYVISKTGEIVKVNRLSTVSYHTSGQNTRSVGICLTGNYDTQSPPEAQIGACVRLIKYLEKRLGRKLDIAGHNQFSSKSCPGSNVSIARIRARVNNFEA